MNIPWQKTMNELRMANYQTKAPEFFKLHRRPGKMVVPFYQDNSIPGLITCIVDFMLFQRHNSHRQDSVIGMSLENISGYCIIRHLVLKFPISIPMTIKGIETKVIITAPANNGGNMKIETPDKIFAFALSMELFIAWYQSTVDAPVIEMNTQNNSAS